MFVLTFIDGLIIFASRSIFDTMPAGFLVALFMIVIQSLLNAPFGFILRPKTEQ
jgi:hypothetical protein